MNDKARSVVFAISEHGFGHIAQLAPVVNAWHQRFPDIQVVIASTASCHLVSSFINCPFYLTYAEQDPGVAMDGPLQVNAEHTYLQYQQWHEQYEQHVLRLQALLHRYEPLLVVSNIGYTILEAARRLHIPTLALSSLNWADIVTPYCQQYPDFETIQAQMLEAYNSATRFVQAEPAMPMPRLSNTVAVAPLARRGVNRRADLLRRLGLPADTQLVVFSLGGIAAKQTPLAWSVPDATHWIIPDNCHVEDARFTRLGDTQLAYIDVLASADVLVTKPGYGSFTEAACNGVAVIYVRRGDWPEEPALLEWLHLHARAVEMSRSQFAQGDFVSAFDGLAKLPKKPAMVSDGVDQVIDIIEDITIAVR